MTTEVTTIDGKKYFKILTEEEELSCEQCCFSEEGLDCPIDHYGNLLCVVPTEDSALDYHFETFYSNPTKD